MRIEELGYQQTPLGDLTLRRRPEPLADNREVYEVKLGDEYLMSSLFSKIHLRLRHRHRYQISEPVHGLNIGQFGVRCTAEQ